jgi:DNA helicase II / ATP-dependent DNA helicase PcrA
MPPTRSSATTSTARRRTCGPTSATGAKIVGFTGYSAHDEAQFVVDEISSPALARALPTTTSRCSYRTNSQTRRARRNLHPLGSALQDSRGHQVLRARRNQRRDGLPHHCSPTPHDALAVRRILNAPKRGIGPATEAAASEPFADRMGITLREALAFADSLRSWTQGRFGPFDLDALLTRRGTKLARATVARGHAHRADSCEQTGYVDELRTKSRDPQDEARAENVEELVASPRSSTRTSPRARSSTFSPRSPLLAAADEIDDETGRSVS